MEKLARIAIAEAVLLLLAHPGERRAMQERAYARGRLTAWPAIAARFATLVETVAAAPARCETDAAAVASAAVRPECAPSPVLTL